MSEPLADAHVKNEQQLVLQGFRAILGALRVPYAACPITGGPRYFAWLEAGGDPQKKNDIIAANVRAARDEIEQLRASTRSPIIDPTQIETETRWAQSDFHALWSQVFTRHVSSLILLPGWELSVGCLKEAKIAYKQGFPVMARDLQPLAMSELVARVQQTLDGAAEKGFPIEDLSVELQALRS